MWRVGTTNPTQLLGKSATLASWNLDLISLSETSHTTRAMRAISSEFRACGYSVGLCRPVPDKFEVGNPLGSFRGLSRGCGLVSRFPLYSFESPVVDRRFWSSHRLHFGVVQVGQLAINVVTIYLWPNAPVSSRRYAENCEVIGAAVQVVRSVSGPAILTGDFNCPLTAFDAIQSLLQEGWADVAMLDARRRGVEPQPTCQRATRHTFCVANHMLLPFLGISVVDFHEDLPTHAVLVTEFELPANNFSVLKWVMPKSMDKLAFNQETLGRLASSVQESTWRNAVDGPLDADKPDESFANWSAIAENALLASAVEEAPMVVGGAWRGRGQALAPVRRQWAPPRFRAGRETDFRLHVPSVALEARRWQKLVRQLESLVRKLKCGPRQQAPHVFEVEVLTL